MTDCFETYGSANLRVVFMDDERGKRIKKDTLFENLYDFWTSYHDPNKKLFWWYLQKIWKLEMSIRKKWNSAVLPLANIILKKYREKDKFFNPEKFLEKLDNEKYFELLKTRKQDVEKTYLDENPHLRFAAVRHEKCLMSKRRSCIRGYFFLVFVSSFKELFRYC